MFAYWLCLGFYLGVASNIRRAATAMDVLEGEARQTENPCPATGMIASVGHWVEAFFSRIAASNATEIEFLVFLGNL